MGKVVGIDLGTTNSVVAVMEGGKPMVVANAEGMRTTSSVVAFSKEGDRFVGQMARRQAVLNPQNTFFAVKRYMGRQYSELNIESKRVPYTIRRDDRGGVKIKCPRLEKEFAPEELSAMILRKLVDDVERYLGETVTGAVITVPAYFNDAQRQATRNAGRIAGLEVKRIINEPTAAALAYGLEKQQNQRILVFDLGGGTFDVSIMEVGDGVFEVKSTSGDTQLGGNDFDRKIVNWLAEQFLEAEGIDLRQDRQALQRLMEASEKAKIELSGVVVTDINLPFITATADDGPKHLETRLARSQFEDLCSDLLERLRGPLKQALTDAALTPNEIDEVVLVGGSTRMPMVQEVVRSFVNREPNQNVNPDEVVAVGAAIQAGILNQDIKDILLLDVTPLSLGLETIGGVMKKLIPRNTTIPVRRSDVFSTGEDNQTLVEVHVLQGEREMASDNKSLGRFKLMGIPPAPRGVPQITVSLDVDANGILQVTAMDKTTGREQGITIQGSSALSETEVKQMIQEADQFSDYDRERRERIEKRNQAEALTIQSERLLREIALDFGLQFANQYRRRIETLSAELKDCLKRNDERGIDIAQADLKDAIYDLNKEVYQIVQNEEEEEGIFGAIKRTIIGDDLYDTPYYDNYNRGGGYGGGGDYRNDGYRDSGYRNDGYRNDGYRNDGYRNDGYRDSGYRDSGYRGDSPRNDGYRNDGAQNGMGRGDGYRDSRGGYDDRGGYGDRPPASGNAPRDSYSRDNSSRNNYSRENYGGAPSRRRPPRDEGPGQSSGSRRYGNSYNDDWDDDDDWL